MRFDELSIRAGVKGIINVMRALNMLPNSRGAGKTAIKPVVAHASSWVRAGESGILRAMVPLGGRVEKGTLLGVIADPFGATEINVVSPFSGIVIGRSNLPLANEGDALFHIARFNDLGDAEARMDVFHEQHAPEPVTLPNPESPII